MRRRLLSSAAGGKHGDGAAGAAGAAPRLAFGALSARELAGRVLTLRVEQDAPRRAVLRTTANVDLGWNRAFGGQLMGQALSAACATVEKRMRVNSCSANFLREGDLSDLATLEVDKVRDGRSFATRHVRMSQAHGEVLDMIVSFHAHEEGLEHQQRRAMRGDPGALPSNEERWSAFAAERGKRVEQVLPPLMQGILWGTPPVQLRHGACVDVLGGFDKTAPEQHLWLRASGDFDPDRVAAEVAAEAGPGAGQLSGEQLSQVFLAFATDFSFLSTSLLPHGTTVWQNKVQPATLSHTLFFHRPVSVRDWLLFDMCSPISSGGRGFVRGELFDSDGTLVASAMQEGLIRPRKFTSSRSGFS
jgi:acyl-CoA thioesterase-2